jgi:hypothetical protein
VKAVRKAGVTGDKPCSNVTGGCWNANAQQRRKELGMQHAS